MRTLRRLPLLLLSAVLLFAARPALAENTLVRVQTTLGPIDFQLLDDQAPKSVVNFLAYVNGGDYKDVFFHRSVSKFVIQAGGYRWPATEASCCQPVTSRGTVQNEFNVSRSNVRGTVAMAKVGGNADSATSQWFVNLADNSTNLDTQNGGFTVFARVTAPGMAVVDRIAALPIVNAGGTYSDLPLSDWTPRTTIQRANVVRIERATVLPVRSTSSDADRIFDYLEAAFPNYAYPSTATTATADGYTYRYYSGSQAYVGVKDSQVWYLVPALGGGIQSLGTLAEWLATAKIAGY